MTRKTLRLRTFGGLELQWAESGMTIGTPRRKGLAVLALLAAQVPEDAGISRERLAAFLWPDADTDRARHALVQTIYHLRRETRLPALVGGDEIIRIERDLLSSDLADFHRAVASAHARVAVTLYAGPFLDGVYFKGCLEFERWAESTRASLAREHRMAAAELAREAECRSDWGEAIRLWQRLFEVDPLNNDAALALARNHAAAGDRLEALRVLHTHEQLLAADLDAPPSEELRRLRDEIRARASGLGGFSTTATESAPPPGPTPRPAMGSSGLRDSSVGAQDWLGRRSFAAIAATVLLLAAIAGSLFVGTSPDHVSAASAPHWLRPPTSGATTLAIFPFSLIGSDSVDDAGEAIGLLLAAGLDDDSLHVRDARRIGRAVIAGSAIEMSEARRAAAELGAQFFILGDARRGAAGELEVSASVYAVAGPAVPQATAHASGNQARIMALADSIAMKLLEARANRIPGRLVQTAARTTHSIDAFKAYLAGEQAFRRGSYGEAMDAYRRAVVIDSQFALAYYRLASAAEWGRDDTTLAMALHRADTLASTLPHRERSIVMARRVFRYGRTDEVVRLLRRTLELYRNDPEASYELAEVLFHSGAAIGQSPMGAAELFFRVANLEPENTEALAHYARTEVMAGRIRTADSLARRVRQLRPAGDRLSNELDLMIHMAAGNRRALERLADSAARAGDEDLLYLATWRVAAYTDSAHLAMPFARRLVGMTTNPILLLKACWHLAQHELNAGRVDRALQQCPANAAGLVRALPARALLVALPVADVARSTVSAYADSLEHWQPSALPRGLSREMAAANGADTWLSDYPRGLLAVRLGNLAMATRAAARLATTGHGSELGSLARSLASTVTAEIALARGDTVLALAELKAAIAETRYRYRLDAFGGMALERFRLAEVLRAAAHHEDAVRWYDTFGGDSEGELAFGRAVSRGRALSLSALSRPVTSR